MATLARDLRKELEKTVKQARRVAETGARKVLEQLGVHHYEPYDSMTPEQRALRNRLRAHGRQLGDRRDRQKRTQTIDRLIQECAYEHWHRMLFARFLAETDLLIEPQSGVAITLEECQELARDEGADWLELASDYAERMLPQIFRTEDPVLAVTLPPETRSDLEDLLKALPRDVFAADDSLGWVYQFWQTEKKEEVNRSGTKIGANELSAVTQLFTEDYMVLFLLHNTLGAWWAGKVLADNPALASSARSENELRSACKVGDFEWTYLRFIRVKEDNETEGPWRPAASTFEGWPKAAKDLTLLDPCMGSGHFLVFALPILVAFRMDEEGLSETAAVDAVLRDNLFGLEIDPRCTQLAAFNLAFAAWRRTGFHTLPILNLACSGLAIGVTKAEWMNLAEKAVMAADPYARRDLLGVEDTLFTHGLEERLKNGLEALYDLFLKAPWLGSLIEPNQARADIFREGFEKLEPLLTSILATADTDESREIAVAAQGMAKAAELLGRTFTLVATNVPYLARGKQDRVITKHLESHHVAGKQDLATAFIERCNSFCAAHSSVAVVSPHYWLFLQAYKTFRKRLLSTELFLFFSRLGAGSFETISGEVVNVVLTVHEHNKPKLEDRFIAVDVSEKPTAKSKNNAIIGDPLVSVDQLSQLKVPDYRITFEDYEETTLLSEFAKGLHGQGCFDAPCFVANFWEIDPTTGIWELQQTTPADSGEYVGCSGAFRWEGGTGLLYDLMEHKKREGYTSGKWRAGVNAWGKPGIAISGMSRLVFSRYAGLAFDENVSVILPQNPADEAAIWAYCLSGQFEKEVRKVDQKFKVTCNTLVKIPFDQAFWHREAERIFPNGLSKPTSRAADQWLFDGNPKHAESPLLVGTARLLGFRWPKQLGSKIPELYPSLPDGIELHADSDGIVCLTALKGEAPAEQRLNALLAGAFGTDWSAAKLAKLLAETGFAGKSLDDWLRDGFFEQHCTLFKQRPFIWHIWDGRRDGFHALVNCHRLAAPNGEGQRTLEKLIYSYLGDWIDRQRTDQKSGVEGADARLAHAEQLRGELINILEGEPPYDIFVRWKPLQQQPIGWEPDINDGVRLNIRPFLTARPLGARAKNSCILRSRPNIKWKKDRGKEPMRDKEDYPWFWGWDETTPDFAGEAKFDGNRWNDLHYSNAFKQAARRRQSSRLRGKT